MIFVNNRINNLVTIIFAVILFLILLFYYSKLNAIENITVLTSDSLSANVSAGELVTIYGTADANNLTVAAGADARLINFPGSNVVTIKSNPCLFTVYRSGATVIFEGDDRTSLKIPATQTPQSIIFDSTFQADDVSEYVHGVSYSNSRDVVDIYSFACDKPAFDKTDDIPDDLSASEFSLVITSGEVMLGDQVIGTDAASIAGCEDILSSRPELPQIGVNFIRFYANNLPDEGANYDTSYLQPDWIFNDFEQMGIHVYRQFVMADLLWDIVEPEDDQWHFEEADTVITNLDFEPVVTLFTMQFASGTPPWETESAAFQKTLGSEAQDYLEKVIERYGKYVRYWELGNEMDHWRAYDPGEPEVTNPYPNMVPPPSGGYSPEEQGLFLSQAAAFIKERDPYAVIVMPGISGLDAYTVNTWLKGVIDGGGSDWFDVINYHYYPEWQSYGYRRASLSIFMEQNNLEDKTVWLTETGSTASSTLTVRTDYPNSYESQASDIFRRIIPAYAMGDSLVLWHTYIDSQDTPTNNWRLYGIRSDLGELHPSYSALKLLTSELIPFDKVEAVYVDPAGANIYQITTAPGNRYCVVWGDGSYDIPDGAIQMTSVVPDDDGSYTWDSVGDQSTLVLTQEPVLLKF
ncbi:exported hypothetical protein [Desulfamplus magnetovallimortis]|uniref:Asl1-like glycosyl hydrolase catalytic domain-containing protein n=1 Tax=Desulfamplus magnetovallimortis TaxID=1246637 RepID=A0A1W1HHW9_9BACT|nr:hypothetical protein [Desulfamplus magnetovallimortis]SLM32040.1 exported hypothetical protein [Desulfamplus magnetovallimortis]